MKFEAAPCAGVRHIVDPGIGGVASRADNGRKILPVSYVDANKRHARPIAIKGIF